MRAGMLALALGLLVLRCLPALPPLWLLLLLPLLGLLVSARQALRQSCMLLETSVSVAE